MVAQVCDLVQNDWVYKIQHFLMACQKILIITGQCLHCRKKTACLLFDLLECAEIGHSFLKNIYIYIFGETGIYR
jgi:hypothetical protein